MGVALRSITAVIFSSLGLCQSQCQIYVIVKGPPLLLVSI